MYIKTYRKSPVIQILNFLFASPLILVIRSNSDSKSQFPMTPKSLGSFRTQTGPKLHNRASNLHNDESGQVPGPFERAQAHSRGLSQKPYPLERAQARSSGLGFYLARSVQIPALSCNLSDFFSFPFSCTILLHNMASHNSNKPHLITTKITHSMDNL